MGPIYQSHGGDKGHDVRLIWLSTVSIATANRPNHKPSSNRGKKKKMKNRREQIR